VATVSAVFFGSADFYVRIGVIAIVVLALVSVLLTRLWALQVVHGSDLRHVAVAQEVRVLAQPAPPGAIVDRRGRPLAGTRAASCSSPSLACSGA
jgi:cell division protein FtsI/penicillin-binding protein 2